MAYIKKTWVARQGKDLNRFADRLTGNFMILDNSPTAIDEQGDSFTANNMNEFESRIDDALQNIDAESITVENGIESSFLNAGLIKSTSEIDAIDLYAESITIEKTGSTGSVKIEIVDGNANVAVNGQIDAYHVTAGGIDVTGATLLQGVTSMGDNHFGNTTATAVTADTATIGALNVNGNINQNGSAYETHAEQVYTKNDKIILRDGAVAGLGVGQYAGFIAQKYDGTNDGHLVFDKDGVARVGDVGSEQPIATREETPTNNGIALWDNTSQKFITKTLANAGIAQDSTVMHNTGNETIAGVKTFASAIIAPNATKKTISYTSTVAEQYHTFILRDNGSAINSNKISIHVVLPAISGLAVGSATAVGFSCNGVTTGYNSDATDNLDGFLLNARNTKSFFDVDITLDETNLLACKLFARRSDGTTKETVYAIGFNESTFGSAITSVTVRMESTSYKLPIGTKIYIYEALI